MFENLPIVFSPHALMKLEQRRLSMDMVVRTLEYPLRIVSIGDRMHAFKKFGRIHLKVIFFMRTEKSIIRPTDQIPFYCNIQISATTLQKLFNVYTVYAS